MLTGLALNSHHFLSLDLMIGLGLVVTKPAGIELEAGRTL